MKRQFITSFVTLIVLTFALLPLSWATAATAAFFQEEEAEEALTQEEYEAHVAQTDAYMAAINEEDPVKRGDMLIAFMSKYPDSSLNESHIKPAYTGLLLECYQNKKYQELEILSEKWLELYPGVRQTISFAATAALQLEHVEKYLGYLLELYDMEPTAEGAQAILLMYDKMGNFEKYVEWCEKAFEYPEFAVDYTLRYKILTKYAENGNIPKAIEYAEKTLEVLDAAGQPDAAGKKVISTIRRECYHLIARDHYDAKRCEKAIEYFDRALKLERFQEGFYYIAQCYWRMEEPEKAHDYFAAAEILGGQLTEKAKEHKEELYRSHHNDTLIGIEKVHKRAQSILDSYDNPDTAQKKTETATAQK